MFRTTIDASPTFRELRRGIGLLVASVVLISCSDAIAKVMTMQMSVMQISLVQATILVLAVPLFAGHARVPSLVSSANLPLQAVRSFCHLASSLCFFTGLRYLPLADMVAIIFVGPLLVTLLGAALLGERVGPRRWGACVVGFLGALVIVRPGLGGIGTTALYPLGSVALYSLYVICTRKLAPIETHGTMLLYTGLLTVVTLGVASPWFWVSPGAMGWLGLAGVGALSCLSAALGIRAYSLAPVSTLAPYSYFEIVAATILGFAVFGDVPDAYTTVGATIIVASGLYVFHREQVRSPA